MFQINCYNDGELDREYEFETWEQAMSKWNDIKKEGVYSYFWGDVQVAKLVGVNSNGVVTKVYDILEDKD